MSGHGEREEFHVKVLNYNTVFSWDEAYNVVEQYFAEKGYEKWEKYAHEYHRKESKEVHSELHYFKEITDYFLIRVKFIINSKDLKYVEVEQHGKKRRMLSGSISFKFGAMFYSDYAGRMTGPHGGSPIWYYIKELYDTFYYNMIKNKYKKDLINDIDQASNKLNNYFNYPKS